MTTHLQAGFSAPLGNRGGAVAPLRVLHALESLRTGGVGMLLCNYYMGMDHSKIAFDFVVNFPEADLADHPLAKEGSRMFYVPKLKHVFRAFFQTRRVIRRGHYRIVHVHQTRHSFVQLLAAWTCGVKVRIAHSHDFLIPCGIHRYTYAIYAWLTSRLATHWFACGEMAGRYVFGKGIHSPRFRLVRNAVFVDRFRFDPDKRAAIRARYHLDDCFVLMHVGRMMPQKNHKRLVSIFDAVQKRNPAARLLLLGDGELAPDIRKQVEELGLTEKVLFVGQTPAVEDFLQAADVFVLPSFHEGFPIVLVEAQASGLPCVMSTNVTPEANLVGLVKSLSLSESDETWAQAICSANNPDRESFAEKIRLAGYDMACETKKLEEWYLQQQP